MAKTVRMTTAQAIVKFLDNQYVSMDGVETKFVEGFFTIFGHGIAVGLGEALDTNPGQLKVLQGRNEQGMCHVATAFAKQSNRKKIIACASSIGPGAANMVTACATATVNNIPLLVFPADTFASRQPDPVLQQLEQSSSLAVSTNDAFKPVCKYWDRITRPEMVMTISGLVILSQYLHTGLNASFVLTARLLLCSSCWRTGSGWRDAKVSAGNTRSGILFTVAVAHAVTMFAAPGPMEEAHAMIFLRLLCFAKAVAT